MTEININSLSKSYSGVTVMSGVDIKIPSGNFTVIVGPSGCGKSTLLRMISGLEDISGGTIHFDDICVNDVDAADRGVAMVFQSYALYPHMTVRDNMGFSLKVSNMPHAEAAQKIDAAASILHLEPLLDRKPRDLSGGQRQRVAIGRAIVRDPKVFLFDEPLSNLDADLRAQLRVELAKLHGMLGSTMVYVTHDQVEAMTLADQIVVMNKGFVEQIGSPDTLYMDPDSLFVASFIGSPRTNTLNAKVAEHNALRLDDVNALVPVGVKLPGVGEAVTVTVRPELMDRSDFESDYFEIVGTVDALENLGGVVNVHLRTDGGRILVVQKKAPYCGDVGDKLNVRICIEDLRLFDADGRRIR